MAVASAVNAIVEWVKEQISKLLNPVLEPINKAFNGWMENIKVTFAKEKILEDLLNAIFSGLFPILLISLAIIITIILGFIGIFINVISIGVTTLMKNLVEPIVLRLLAQAIIGLIIGGTVGAVISIESILAGILPMDHPFWKSGIGLDILGLASVIGVALSKHVVGLKVAVGDIKGLIIALLGISLTVVSTYITNLTLKIFISFFGVALSVYGFVETLKKDFLDYVAGIFALVEEIISFGGMLWSSIQLGLNIGNYISGG